MDLHALQLAEDRLVLDEADVDFAIEHLARNFVEAAAIDADLDLRMRAQIRLERPGQQIDRRRFVRRDRYAAGHQPPQIVERSHRLVAHAHHAARVFGEELSGRRQAQLRRVAREQRRADRFFELLDALADRRLRAIDTFRRPRERSFVHDRQEMFELQQIHG